MQTINGLVTIELEPQADSIETKYRNKRRQADLRHAQTRPGTYPSQKIKRLDLGTLKTKDTGTVISNNKKQREKRRPKTAEAAKLTRKRRTNTKTTKPQFKKRRRTRRHR